MDSDELYEVSCWGVCVGKVVVRVLFCELL